MNEFSDEIAVMHRALELATRGEGRVEPNPCVGAVIVDENLRLIGEGYHPFFGGPHAEVMALENAGVAARGATLFVTLEPCSHHGKTPPCSDAVIAAGIRRVVISVADPAKHDKGSGAATGIEQLRAAGIEVSVGMCGPEGSELLAPFTTFMMQRRPFVHAKWAMTLDGKLATRTGHSQWISNEQSRAKVHALRSRMDAILVGIGTALADDPMLTARPSGSRTPLRVVLDPNARLPLDSQLVKTSSEIPLLVFVSEQADKIRVESLKETATEVIAVSAQEGGRGLELLPVLTELARRDVTNLLVEGGSHILGAFHDADFIDEVHCFVAPKIVGGEQAKTPIAGQGAENIPQHPSLIHATWQSLDGDLYLRGRVDRSSTSV